MQSTYTGSILKEGKLSVAWKAFRLVILIVCIGYVTSRLSKEELQLIEIQNTIIGLPPGSWLALILVVAMAPANWTLEALKWKMLIKPIQYISLYRSLISVLSGHTFGFITPREIGDYFGRMLIIDDVNKPKVIVPLFVSRIAQLIPTLVVGMSGVYYFSESSQFNSRYLYMSAGLLVLTGTLLVSIIPLSGLLVRSFGKKIGTIAISVLAASQKLQLNKILLAVGLSFLRYIIFASQFLIVMLVFGVDGNLVLLIAGISWIFLAKSIIPSFSFLNDLGIREFSALIFFQSFGVNIVPVLTASLFIWLLNIVLPSFAGMLFINKSRG